MKQRSIETQEQLEHAASDLLKLAGNMPFVITITAGTRIRTSPQNKMYWSELQFFMNEISQAVSNVAEHTGYSELEVKRLISNDMEPEQAAILFVRSKEAVHEVLKMIVGIPTSTKLGTKDFNKFTERLAQVMSEILGIVNMFERKAKK